MIKKIQNLCRKVENVLFPATQKKLKIITFGIYDILRLKLLEDDKFKDKGRLERFGFKVYCQNDEDGIIQEIFKRIGTTNKTFVEFGAYDGLENNTAYLLMQGWKGLWIDGDPKKMKVLRKTYQKAIVRNQLYAECNFITKDNINEIIGKHLSGEIDLLSIDIDGNDYHVWKNISVIKPRVVITEYNGKFPPPCSWVMEYDENYFWQGGDEHGDKQGMSLQAAVELGEQLGYQLVGTNINGVNAFFVRKDCISFEQQFPRPATAEHLYNHPRYNMTLKSGHPAKYFLG
jgi:hypothetical protein